MAGVTSAQSLRYATVDDPVSATFTENLAEDIARELDAIEAARVVAMKPPVAIARNIGGQSIPVGGVGTVLQWTTEEIDTHGMIDLVSNNTRITVSSAAGAGLYWVDVIVGGSVPSAWSMIELSIRKNGGVQARRKYWNTASTTQTTPKFGMFIWLGAVTDYVDVVLYHEGGASESTSGGYLKVVKRTTN